MIHCVAELERQREIGVSQTGSEHIPVNLSQSISALLKITLISIRELLLLLQHRRLKMTLIIIMGPNADNKNNKSRVF